jgi:hypothetical protein
MIFVAVQITIIIRNRSRILKIQNYGIFLTRIFTDFFDEYEYTRIRKKEICNEHNYLIYSFVLIIDNVHKASFVYP